MRSHDPSGNHFRSAAYGFVRCGFQSAIERSVLKATLERGYHPFLPRGGGGGEEGRGGEGRGEG